MNVIRDTLALLFALVFPSIVTWLYFVQFGGGGEGKGNLGVQLAYSVGKTLQFGFPVVFVWLVHREALRWTKPDAQSIWIGLGFGLFVAMGALVLHFAWLKPSGMLDEAARVGVQKLQQMNMAAPVRFLLLAVFYSLAHSFLEEYYWRWFVFGWLRQYLPLWIAITIASLGFMAHHVILLWVYFPERIFLIVVPFSLAVAIGGVFWCWLYDHSGSLYGPWLSHLLVDAAIFAVGYDLVSSQWQT